MSIDVIHFENTQDPARVIAACAATLDELESSDMLDSFEELFEDVARSFRASGETFTREQIFAAVAALITRGEVI